ncbi:MAG: hypothetical protein SW127_14300 [Actinomycetota bacterium]|nr:hypothetical protein [Actinomycetota bacterium]
MSDLPARLDKFRNEVNWNLAWGALADEALAVTSDEGGCPVVVALEEETMSLVFERLRAVGGAANLFVRGDGQVRIVSVIDESCAIATPDDDMSAERERPAADATVGMFLDYLTTRPNGVAISAALGHPARARDPHPVEFGRA